jgi:RNA ligase (TIGR02306 family)
MDQMFYIQNWAPENKMRTLVSVQKINNILPIPGADNIELITMGGKGWQCVVKKGEFKPGDLCLYHEIDGLLPNTPQYSFLSRGNKLKKCIIEDGKEVEGFRLKTIRLRGVISQGLALPLSSFKGIIPEFCEVGMDLTDTIGVFKYEPPIPVHLSGELKGFYPGFLFKTDELRLQADTSILERHRGKKFYATSKIDGTSSTFYKHEGEFGVCGHRWEFKDTASNTFWRLAHKYKLPERFPDGYAIQGETAGEGVQENRLRLKGIQFFAFYVIDIIKGEYLSLDDMKHFVKDLGLSMVPVVEENFVLNHTLEEFLKLADHPSPLNPEMPQEGLVFRLQDDPNKVSFKVVSNEYLIKWGL